MGSSPLEWAGLIILWIMIDAVLLERAGLWTMIFQADSRFAPSQWETALLCNDVSHWLSAKLESALYSLDYWHFNLFLKERKYYWYTETVSIVFSPNALRLKQNGNHFAGEIFTCIFLNWNVWISNKISLKFVPKGQFNNIPALVQIMAWCRPGATPLSEPMMVSLMTYICVTLPQWVKKTLIQVYWKYHLVPL